jgi:hypothetical protein
MNGFVRKAALVIGCTLGAVVVGCETLPKNCGPNGCDGGGAAGFKPTAQELTCCSNQLYDRCWPERYNNLAIREVNRGMTPQVLNGHVLDQTVWNHYFEDGTDRLTPGGQAALQYISRRRPCPDTTIYLATALDLPYDPACPDRYCGARQELDSLRAAAIQKYLTGLNCGRPTDFHVCVHDPADVTVKTVPVGSSIIQMYARYRGGLGVGAGVASGAAAAAGPSGAGTGTIR